MNKLISIFGLVMLFCASGCTVTTYNNPADAQAAYDRMGMVPVRHADPSEPCWMRGQDTPYQSACPGQAALYEPSHPVYNGYGYAFNPR